MRFCSDSIMVSAQHQGDGLPTQISFAFISFTVKQKGEKETDFAPVENKLCCPSS